MRIVIIALILIASLLCACSASATPAISAAPSITSPTSVSTTTATQQPAFKPSNPAAEDVSVLPADRWCILSPCETETINNTIWTSYGKAILLRPLQKGDSGTVTIQIKDKKTENNAEVTIANILYSTANGCWAAVLFKASCLSSQQSDLGKTVCFKK